MELPFYKYQATGNDFILIDNRELVFPKERKDFIAQLCHRRFGIGADGLILLENHDKNDFKMVYFNSDGREGSMCGNGGRSVVHFAHYLGVINSECIFEAVDGLHEAIIKGGLISLKMADVQEIIKKDTDFFLDTGSPHHVRFLSEVKDFDVVTVGRNIRNDEYGEKGSNVNFVESVGENSFFVRTYERGVEDETYSCGTGVTAVALVADYSKRTSSQKIKIKTRGGELSVDFEKEGDNYKNIFLTGPAVQVFKGFLKW